MMSGTPARLYTTAEAAEQLRMSPAWLKRQASSRKVQCVRMGRSVRFTDADIAAIIADRTRPAVQRGGKRSTL